MDFIIAMALAKGAQHLWESHKKKVAQERAQAQARQAAHERACAEERKREEARREAQERAQRCCASCATIVSKDAAFCHSCGAAALTTIGAIRDKQAAEERLRQQKLAAERKREEDKRAAAARIEEQKRQQKLAEEQARREELQRQRQRREAARNRCLELLAMRYCPSCNTAYSPNHKYCTACGTATEPFHERWAYEYARDEYPDIFKTEDDFKQLLNDRNA